MITLTGPAQQWSASRPAPRVVIPLAVATHCRRLPAGNGLRHAPIACALLSAPVPFTEAANMLAAKVLLPTSLTHKELAELDDDIKLRSLWAAQVDNGEVLDQIGGSLNDLVAGKTDIATQRLQISKMAESLGQPLSEGRINLILGTNLNLAYGYGQMVRAFDPDLIDEYPAWRLVRWEDRIKPRDWDERWAIAAEGTPEEGRNDDEYIALKTHPIWDNLGDSDLFDDALDTTYPPFAFNSGMGVEDIDRDEAIAAGVIDETTKLDAPDLPGFADGFSSSYAFRCEALRDDILADNPDLEFVDGVLQPVEDDE